MKSKIITIEENRPKINPTTFSPEDGKFNNQYKIVTGDKDMMFTIIAEFSTDIPVNVTEDYEVILILKNVEDGTVTTFE